MVVQNLSGGCYWIHIRPFRGGQGSADYHIIYAHMFLDHHVHVRPSGQSLGLQQPGEIMVGHDPGYVRDTLTRLEILDH